MTLSMKSLLHNGTKRIIHISEGVPAVQIFDPVIAIPSTESETPQLSWTVAESQMPAATGLYSYVCFPWTMCSILNDSGITQTLNYRIKVNGVSELLGSSSLGSRDNYQALRLSTLGGKPIVPGDVVTMYFWGNGSMDIERFAYVAMISRLFPFPPSGVHRSLSFSRYYGGVTAEEVYGYTYLNTTSRFYGIFHTVNADTSQNPATSPTHSPYTYEIARQVPDETMGIWSNGPGDQFPNGVTSTNGYIWWSAWMPITIEILPAQAHWGLTLC